MHDGFWAAPCPAEEHITQLPHFLSDRYSLSPHDPPLFRYESLRHKSEALKNELVALPIPLHKRRKLTAGTPCKHPLPPHAALRRKRTYQADSIQAQPLLVERLAKRARFVSFAKKRQSSLLSLTDKLLVLFELHFSCSLLETACCPESYKCLMRLPLGI